MREPPVEISTLGSGLRLVTQAMPSVRSVAIGFWVGTGSRDEDDEVAGASHFLEHLLFKGTPNRPAAAIAEALDEVGGDCNAFTSKEYTAFYLRLLADHVDLGLDILCDIMWDPALAAADVEAERTVILDEILMHQDEPAELASSQWQRAAFPHHPLGRDTLGSAESVGSLSADQVRAFFEHHYRPANIVVSVAGDCHHEAVAEGLERRFCGRPGGAPPRREPPTAPPVPRVLATRATEQVQLVLGCRSVSRHDERRFAVGLLNHVLGGGLSSRLFQKVREQRGLAYSVGSERLGYHDVGTLTVAAGTAPEHWREVLGLASDELELLADQGVTERELAVAKAGARADLLLAAEDSGARMSRLGAALLLHGQVLAVDELLARIEEVTTDAVQEVAVELASAPRTLAAVGPFDEADLSAALEATGPA